jgi:hypothetical protein
MKLEVEYASRKQVALDILLLEADAVMRDETGIYRLELFETVMKGLSAFVAARIEPCREIARLGRELEEELSILPEFEDVELQGLEAMLGDMQRELNEE